MHCAANSTSVQGIRGTSLWIWHLQVLVTGATGFIGMNLLGAVAEDDSVSKVYCVVWDQELKGLSVEEFKKNMMGMLGMDHP